jgi:hypothetical protein
MIIEESRSYWRAGNNEDGTSSPNNTGPEKGGSLAGSPSHVAERLMPEERLDGGDWRHLEECGGQQSISLGYKSLLGYSQRRLGVFLALNGRADVVMSCIGGAVSPPQLHHVWMPCESGIKAATGP